MVTRVDAGALRHRGAEVGQQLHGRPRWSSVYMSWGAGNMDNVSPIFADADDKPSADRDG